MGALDMLLCNALVIDPVLGIVKGDLGIKDGKIVGVGKAGNPATMDGVHPKLIVGAATTVRRRGNDSHARRHRCPCSFRIQRKVCERAISSGLTTMIGGWLGPITVGIDYGGALNIRKMLQASEHWPIDFRYSRAGAIRPRPRSILDQIGGGCIEFKIHEDWGEMPEDRYLFIGCR